MFYLTFSLSKSSEIYIAPRIFSTSFGTVFMGHFFHPLLIYVLGRFLGHILGTLFYNFLGHFLWPPSTAVLYLISLKSLISFENIAHDGTFSTVNWLYRALPVCTWLCLGLPCSNLPQTATDCH